MLRMILTWVIILNISTITLSNAMLITNNKAIRLGDIKCGESCRVEVEQEDSLRVVFRLGDDWIGTDLMKCDTIIISDKTETFEVEILEIGK